MASQGEQARLASLEKKRKQMMDDFESQKDALKAETARKSGSGNRFTGQTEGVDDQLKKATYGLVHLQDFRETREKLEEEARREAAGANELREDERPRKKKKKKTGGKMLSFAMDDEEEGDGDEGETSERTAKKVSKDPSVNTSFLPDREREEAERKVRDELRKEWLRKQEEMKAEEIEITYSYWDGSGHRNSITCKKGDTIAAFLEGCRKQTPELRGVSADNLMYIKEDLIMPHHYTFYDFIVNRYRGKSGPLFNFDVHDDVRLLADATVEKDESHAGKVVERSWYNRSKHIFPASRWEVFNPSVQRDKYTIHGD